ncbi:hypothetical protein [Cellulosilyticum sp. WCF-2]|uniref:hypothetical protein n=1 Tax=Cellulosilyticum sp. WCF-2 TaxID=2497860 RepID=UPI000F8E0902|nr:hypothetical protein [Cellulosilyticum sp. WCF-2]QEH70014.1 hypothetical protein EKH84_17085 [Cellulosilyticum sp. WCF-2]
MKRVFKMVLVVNVVLLVSVFFLYMSNKSKQEEITSNMISIQALERQLDQVKANDEARIDELEKKLTEQLGEVNWLAEKVSTNLEETQPWGRHINAERKEFYGDWKITEVLKSNNKLTQKDIATIISLGRKDIKVDGAIVAKYPYYYTEILPYLQKYLAIDMGVKQEYIVRCDIWKTYEGESFFLPFITFYLIDCNTLLAFSDEGTYYKLERVAHEKDYTEYWFDLRDIENAKW